MTQKWFYKTNASRSGDTRLIAWLIHNFETFYFGPDRLIVFKYPGECRSLSPEVPRDLGARRGHVPWVGLLDVEHCLESMGEELGNVQW